MNNDNGFDLSVTISAADWGCVQRRMRYLEAVLIQVVRDRHAVKEWFSASELADLRLPGLASGKGAITRQAREQEWLNRLIGYTLEYHFSCLPRRAFEALIERVIAPASIAPTVQMPTFSPPDIPPPAAKDVSPTWLLPLMRVIRYEAAATVGEALEILPDYLPKGALLPTESEALEALRSIGLVS